MLIAGVALAVASLGGLYSLYHLDIRPILGIGCRIAAGIAVVAVPLYPRTVQGVSGFPCQGIRRRHVSHGRQWL